MNASDVIDARYRLERLLGTGGMSEVWLAEDQRLGRWVAVKLLRDDGDPALVTTLEREARLVARLQHPNIAAVFDTGRHEARTYLVMEYIHGHSLRGLLEARSRLSEAEAIHYGLQAAAALEYAHGRGVIHCDMKPENILVDEAGVAKVVDFGIAETMTRTLGPQQARDVLGTLAYLAPEVLQGSTPDARSDVYSLALTIYELVAGRLPFAGNSAAAIAGQRLAAPAPPLRTLAAQASMGLEAALARALALNPMDRFPSAAEFATALRRVPSNPAQGVVAPVTVPRPAPVPVRQPTSRITRVPRGGVAAPRASNSGAIIAVTSALLIAVGIGVAAALIIGNNNSGGGTEPTPTATLPPTSTPAGTPTRPPTSPAATPTQTTAASPSPPATPTVNQTPQTAAPNTPTKAPSATPRPSATVVAATATPAPGTPPPTRTPAP